jgi:hypothetical protein
MSNSPKITAAVANVQASSNGVIIGVNIGPLINADATGHSVVI